MYQVCECITTLVACANDEDDEIPHYSIVDLEDNSQASASVLISRLLTFLSTRIPNNKMDLLPRYHWVWDSLKRSLKTIAMMMMVSKHIIEYDEVKYRKQDESLLTGRDNFTTANITL